MAELLVAGRWVYPGPLGAYLRDALSDDYCVVLDPVVRRCPLDAIVVGPNGLTGLKIVALNGDGVIQAGEGTSAWAQNALRLFLRDEFPSLRPALAFRWVARVPSEPARWVVTEPVGMPDNDLAHAIAAQPVGPDSVLASQNELREAVALALRDRQLTATERAIQPFVFRSAGALGNAARAWTIRDVVLHMDRHPDDGIYHLRNGTLAAWLEAEGAAQLAQLARVALQQTRADPWAQLETFLLGTGLVKPLRLVVRPRVLDLGYVVAGGTAAGTVRIQRGRGRGYLFGNLAPCEPWLDAEPRSFAGMAAIAVRGDSAKLGVATRRYEGAIELRCSASPEPVALPVRLRVVARPAPVARYLLRPLAAGVLAGALGAAAGAALDQWGAAFRAPLAAALPWTLIVGLLWAVLGFVRGLRQPQAWPVLYAAGHWLIRLAAAAVVLPALVMSLAWLWARAAPESTLASPGRTAAALVALACAVLPATLSEMDAARAHTRRDGPQVRSLWRRVALPVAGTLLILALIAGWPVLRPAAQRADVQHGIASVQAWAADAWTRLDAAVGGVMDRAYLNYYDRRAPGAVAPAAAREPQPTATPTTGP